MYNLVVNLYITTGKPCTNHGVMSSYLSIHLDPPMRPVSLHRPYYATTQDRNHTNTSKQPSTTNSCDQRCSHHGAYGGKDVADAVVESHTGRGLAGHELGKHSSGHAKDHHASDAKEEICCELMSERVSGSWDERGAFGSGRTYRNCPMYSLLCCPAKPDQSSGI